MDNESDNTPYSTRTPILPDIFDYPVFAPSAFCNLHKGVQTLKANMWHKLELCAEPSEGYALLVIGRSPLSTCTLPILGQTKAPFEYHYDGSLVEWPFRVRPTEKVIPVPWDIQGEKGFMVELKGEKEIEIFFTRMSYTVSACESVSKYTLKDVRGWQLEMRHVNDETRSLTLPLPLKVVNRIKTGTEARPNGFKKGQATETLISKIKKLSPHQLHIMSSVSDALLDASKNRFDSQMSLSGPSSTEEDSDGFPGDLFIDLDA